MDDLGGIRIKSSPEVSPGQVGTWIRSGNDFCSASAYLCRALY